MTYGAESDISHKCEFILDIFFKKCQGFNSYIHRRYTKKIDLQKSVIFINQVLIEGGDMHDKSNRSSKIESP